MIKVLFLTYYFPPLGGAGVQRTVKFLKYLPQYGFEPIVITGPGIENTCWAPIDDSLNRELANSFSVCRIPLPYKKPTGILNKVQRWLPVENSFSKWWYSNCVDIIKNLMKEDIRLIYASMSPFESTLVADYFWQNHGIPWVADLRDPWALDEMQIYPTIFHRKIEFQKMKRFLGGASGIIMNTPEAETRLKRAFPEFLDKKITFITNGYDAEDFASSPEKRINKKFTIVHTGYLHTEMGHLLRKRYNLYRTTGGVTLGLDILTRSHVFLLKAVENWISLSPENAERVELVFAGEISEGDKCIIKNSRIAELVRLPGYLSHPTSVSLIRNADLLFLPMHNLSNGVRATIVPGKTYEYMATGNPILAAVPEGDAKDFLHSCGTGLICKPDDVEGMVAILYKVFRAWQQGEKIVKPNVSFVEKFERKNLTAGLANFFDSLLQTELAKQ